MTKKQNLLNAIVLFYGAFFVWFGCATPKPTITENRIEGYKIIESVPALLLRDGESVLGLPVAFGLISFRMLVKDSTLYSISIKYSSESWMFIESGFSLKMLIDGRKKQFYSGNGSAGSREVNGSYVHETADYICFKKDFYEIINAKDLLIQVTGSKGFADCRIKEDRLQYLVDFVKEYVK